MPKNILLNPNLLSNLATAAGIVETIARKKIPGKGWTVIPSIWEDNTFRIEYRHAAEDGLIHRFMYAPHTDPDHIEYYVHKMDGFMQTIEGKFLYDSEIPVTERIPVPQDHKYRKARAYAVQHRL